MSKENLRTKKVFQKSIAIDLRKRGFGIIRTEPNYKKPQFDVYIFVDTPRLEEAFSEIIQERKDRKAKYLA